MKRILTCIFLLFQMLFCTYAQDNAKLAEIISRLKDNRVLLNYECVLRGQAPVKLNGSLIIQSTSYIAKGNGVEIYCNGIDRWTVDPEAKEVYIEKAEPVEELLTHTSEISDLTVSDVKYLPLGDTAAFSFDTSALDASWIVTDLREE